MTSYDKPRLCRKTMRAPDLAVSFAVLPKEGEAKGQAEGRRFAFASKAVLKQKKHTETSIRELKPRPGLVLTQKTRLSPSLSRLSFHTRLATPTRHHTPSPSLLSQTLTPAYTQSLQVSQQPSPRTGGLLTIEAINLELELTAMLAQIETKPSPQRRREALAAHMSVLHSLSLRDPRFGPLISRLHECLSHLLQSIRIKEASELRERNKELNRYIADHMLVLKQEAGEKAAGERVYETLRKEKTLLEKKVEELQIHYKRTEERVGEMRESWDKKAEEMEEMLKAARKRELRLLQLLDRSKAVPYQPPASIPPIDFLLSKDFSLRSLSADSSDDSTEEVSSPCNP